MPLVYSSTPTHYLTADSLPIVENNQKLRESFGAILLKLRKEKGVSQKVVADNCNFERVFITHLEKGSKQPTLTTIFKLAEYFEVLPGDMLNEAYALLKKPKN